MKISVVLTLPSGHVQQARELLDSAIDQLAVRGVPVYDLQITEECADTPENAADAIE